MKKILIIEDEESIAELERDYLEMHGCKVDIAMQGDVGLQMALEESYDLILLDIMPQINGFELCKQIRERKDVPILMVSARREDIDKIRGFGLGADDFIVKPFSPSELVARVGAHLARFERLTGSRQKPGDELKIRGLIINRSSRQVFADGKEVILTAKEFDLLTCLVTNPNQVFSKEQLFNKIWGFDSLGDIATVTVHIRKIREKIESDPSDPQYIETIWGVGYRFRG